APEKRGDSVRHRPDMQRYHLAGRTARLRQSFDELLCRRIQHIEGPVGGLLKHDIWRFRQARFEHRGIVSGLVAGEGEIGSPDIFQRLKRRRTAAMPRLFEIVRKALEPKARHLGHQFLPIAEMTIRRSRADACRTGGLGNRETSRPLLADKAQSALNESLPQIAMMISAPPGAAMLPAHVRKIYMAWPF